MPKIIVCQGIPASGKSTWARKFVESNSKWVRINRDDIRRMFGEYWVPSREDLVSDTEKFIATAAAYHEYNIVVDDSNLNQKYINTWKSFAELYKYDIEFKLFKVSLEEAIERDSKRENPVGENVIRDFYKRYYDAVQVSNISSER